MIIWDRWRRQCRRHSLARKLLLKRRSEFGINVGGVTISVKTAIQNAIKPIDSDDTTISHKFLAPPKGLVMGRPVDAALGLSQYLKVSDAQMYSLMQQGVPAILHEFDLKGSVDDRMWLDYVLNQPAAEERVRHGIRDQGRNGEVFADFVSHSSSRQANLSDAHVLALRLYTTPCYESLNKPLRDTARESAHPFAATVGFLNEGIRRLRSVGAVSETANEGQVLWRGMANISVSDEFMSTGGTEVAPMSTTSSLEVAVQYGLSQSTLLFRLTTTSFMDRGASLEFLSAFPAEHEVLYPPMTFLRPRGEPYQLTVNEIDFTVVHVEPVFGS